MKKQIDKDEQALRNILRTNIKNCRLRKNWSQNTLAAKIDMSTNFLADIEAGNTWVSAKTLVKLAQAFEIEAFELLKPDMNKNSTTQDEVDQNRKLLNQFTQDLNVILKDSVEKSVEYLRKQYKKNGLA